MSTGDDQFPLSGERLLDRESLVHSSGMGILIHDGKIERIDDSEELISEFAPWYPSESRSAEVNVLDANGMAVVPGFVDSHTHLVWAGDRTNELSLRLAGSTYRKIAEMGGGIWKTVISTRSAPQEEIVNSGLRRVHAAMKNGTTSMEAKSGYGLDVNSEVKILEAVSIVDRESPCDIIPTWLGAHDFPKEMSRSDYTDELISEQIPVINELGLAKWADVFCEPGWFTIEETEDIVNAAKGEGMGSRLHVDEFVDGGGLELASELGAASGDHVACSNDDSRIAAAESGTVQTFLPGTPYVLGKDLDLPISKCISEDWPFSIATDFNPNCPIISLPFIGSLLSHRMGIDPIVSLAAATRNPSTTIFPDTDVRGVIAEGNKADLNVLWSNSADSWCQTPGTPSTSITLIDGIIVNQNKTF